MSNEGLATRERPDARAHRCRAPEPPSGTAPIQGNALFCYNEFQMCRTLTKLQPRWNRKHTGCVHVRAAIDVQTPTVSPSEANGVCSATPLTSAAEGKAYGRR